MWTSFKEGIARGFGITLGMSVVLGLFIWILTMLVNLPVVGEYFEKLERYVTEYSEKTNYADEFEEVTRLLGEIRENTEK